MQIQKKRTKMIKFIEAELESDSDSESDSEAGLNSDTELMANLEFNSDSE